eukprot:TRINITY_DN4033_c0_g2_i1.p1 TRINITY_DN4033_c0_g2~~TRINITY_DN4033_c0_g2_i1.p1  ORF type:complete len:485 (+),score=93.44 TRINITY_DN4033_c0_g2_i1:189-1457(+)
MEGNRYPIGFALSVLQDRYTHFSINQRDVSFFRNEEETSPSLVITVSHNQIIREKESASGSDLRWSIFRNTDTQGLTLRVQNNERTLLHLRLELTQSITMRSTSAVSLLLVHSTGEIFLPPTFNADKTIVLRSESLHDVVLNERIALTPPTSSSHSQIGTIGPVFIGGIVLGVVIVACIWYLFRKKRVPVVNVAHDMPPMIDIDVGNIWKYTTLKNFGVAFDQNATHRAHMEDAHLTLDNYGDIKGLGFFSVYDGHGGIKTVNYIKDNLHENLLKEMKKGDPQTISMEQVYKTVYAETNVPLIEDKEESGCTALCCVIQTRGIVRHISIANVGDTRAVLSSGGKAIRMSRDHKPTDEDERARLKEAGIGVFNKKVAGVLAVSRAFGDAHLAKYLSIEPCYFEREISEEDKFLILACDGVSSS